MGVPHEIKPIGGITVGSGGSVVAVVKLPSRVRIHKIIVTRTDTVGSGSFSVDLFNLEDAANGTTVKDANNNDLPPELFRVMPTIAGANGKAEYFADAGTGGYGFPFFSQQPDSLGDGHPQGPDRAQSNQRVVFVKITSTAGWVFAINIGTETDLI